MSYSFRGLRCLVDCARRRAMCPHLLAAYLIAVSGVVACAGSDRADREVLLQRADAQRLVGAWDVTMVLDHPLTQLHDPRVVAAPVTGTAAFTANRHSELTVTDFGVVTHKGVFDVDLTPFSLPFGDEARTQSAVARTIPISATGQGAAASASADSVIIALIPGDSRLTIRMSGVLAGNTVSGSWAAEFLRTQASGRFTMQRHTGSR